MRKEYDFSQAIKNPYIHAKKTTLTLSVDQPTLEYFKALSEQANVPYEELMYSFLAECAVKKLKPAVKCGCGSIRPKA